MTTALSPDVSVAEQLPSPPSLAQAGSVSLFLDFDGTLVEIADHPQDVIVAPSLPQALAALSDKLEGRLAVVSGRSLAALDHLLGPVPIAMAGSHGGEFRPSRSAPVQPLAEPLPASACEAMAAFAKAQGDLVFEAKPFSVAVHYRDRPEVADALLAYAQRIGAEHGLRLKHGKMVIEMSMPGSDKGNAVAHFMDLAPFAGTRPLFAGDDVTDEDAFAAVRRYDGGGILVGPMRATRALWHLDNVAAVHRWLENAV
jgi:trehalose 6-phosphate phosphatase